MYAALKLLHIGTVLFSVGLFAGRWWLALKNSPLLQQRWLKLLPRINDSVLLAAATAMVLISEQYPLAVPWLTAKLLGLVLYIILGTLALKSWRLSVRRAAGVAALTTALYIMSVAVSKNVWGFFLALE